MIAQQLPLFGGPITGALEKIDREACSYGWSAKLISMMAATTVTARPGSVLVATASSRMAEDELRQQVLGSVAEMEKARESSKHGGIVEVAIPAAMTGREFIRELMQRYRKALHCAQVQYRHRPHFALDYSGTWVTDSERAVICQTIRSIEPRLIVLTNFDNLCSSSASAAEKINACRVIADIALESGSTHVAFGAARPLLALFKVPEITTYLEPFVLFPYAYCEAHLSSKRNAKSPEAQEWERILSDYDSLLPWDSESVKLSDHAFWIHSRVSGDPERLKRWIIKSLRYACSVGAFSFDWTHFLFSQPSGREVTEASEVYGLARSHLPSSEPSANVAKAPNKQGKKRKPGHRKPTRDMVAA